VNGSFSAAIARALRACGVLLLAGVSTCACSGESETGATTSSTTTTRTEATSPETTLTVETGEAQEETTAPAEAVPEHSHALWSQRKLWRLLARASVRVEGRRVPVDPATLTCGGESAGRLRGGVRVWTHFSCIQPTFPQGALVGPDALFRVHATGRTTFVVTDASFSRY
jgi:hypothetical protein